MNTVRNASTYAARVRKRHFVDDLDVDNLNNAGVGRILKVPTPAVHAGMMKDRETPMQSHLRDLKHSGEHSLRFVNEDVQQLCRVGTGHDRSSENYYLTLRAGLLIDLDRHGSPQVERRSRWCLPVVIPTKDAPNDTRLSGGICSRSSRNADSSAANVRPYSLVIGTRKMKSSFILIVPEDIWQNTL